MSTSPRSKNSRITDEIRNIFDVPQPAPTTTFFDSLQPVENPQAVFYTL